MLLPESRVVPGLGAGATSTGDTVVTIPASVPAGTYTITASADASNAIVESIETNNFRATQVTIGP